MADISLKIKANFEEASKQFKSLADASEATRQKIERFTEEFKSEQIDRFIDRQEMLSVAMASTGRSTDAVNTQVQNYQREIERLIKSGLDPQDEALQKLQAKYAELSGEQERIKQATEAEAQAAAALAEQNEKVAAAWAATIDAGTAYEKKIAGLTHEKSELKKEIQELIRAGHSPESEEVKKLEEKYKDLTKEIKENKDAHTLQEKAGKVGIGIFAGLGAAIGAAAGFSLKAAAANEDMIASFAPMMGGDFAKAGELFKNIQKEAAATPFEIDAISASVRALMPALGGSSKEAMKAFKMLGDTAQGNSKKLESITNAYNKSMMTGKVSQKELQTIAGAGVPIYDQLSKSMRVSTAELMELSSKGKLTSADLTGAFQQMTSEGGLFYKGMETASDTFNMRVLGLKENIGILAGVIGERLLPAAKEIIGKILDAVTGFTDWIQKGDNFKKTMETVAIVVGGVTLALVGFLVVSKGAAVLSAFTKALHFLKLGFVGLNTAMKANVIIAVVSLLITAGVLIYKNWDVVFTYLQQGMARLKYAWGVVAGFFSSSWETKLDLMKIAFSKYSGWIVDMHTFVIRKLLELSSLLPGAVGNAADFALGKIQGVRNAITGLTASIVENSNDETKALLDTLDADLAKIDAEAEARRATLKANGNADIAELEAVGAAKDAIETESTEKKKERERTELELFRERLNETILTDQQAYNQRLETVTEFLAQRAALQSDDYAEQLKYIEEHSQEMLALYEKESAERIAIEEGLTKAIDDIRTKQVKKERELLEARLEAVTMFTSGMGQLLEQGAENNHAAAVTQRALASAEAFINSYLAFTALLNPVTSGIPYPFNLVAAAGTLASGLAAQIKIISTPLSAETGGRFVVPNVSAGVDGVGLRVNPGETIDVTPRGEEAGYNIYTIFKIQEQTIFEVVNKGIKSGEIRSIEPARNL